MEHSGTSTVLTHKQRHREDKDNPQSNSQQSHRLSREAPNSLIDCLTWDDGNGVSFPGYNADILLHSSGDEALEHSYVAPH